MRQKHARAVKARRKKQEPLSEGLQKKIIHRIFTVPEISHIKKRHRELAAKGMNNRQIARHIANRLGRTLASAESKIIKLIKEGELGENPNQKKAAAAKRFTESEIDYIKKRYRELAAKGKSNRQISDHIACSMRRNRDSVGGKIRELIKGGELDKNPNKRRVGATRRFTESDVDHIKKRYRELAAKGKSNIEIAREIADSMGRTVYSVNCKIRKLTKKGQLGGNPNQKKAAAAKKFTESDIAYIKKRYRELAAEGKKTAEIAKEIASNLGRTMASIDQKARKLIKRGELEKNPNQRRPRDFLSNMADDELVGYAKEVIANKGIASRTMLEKNDCPLYKELCKRGLVDRVFNEIYAEQAQLQEDRLLSDIRECFDSYTEKKG